MQDLSSALCDNNRTGGSVKCWDSLPTLHLVFTTKKGSKLGGYIKECLALHLPCFLHLFSTHLLGAVGDRTPGQNQECGKGKVIVKVKS